MKKIIFALFVILTCLSPSSFITFADNSFYAKIQSDNVFFFSSPINSSQYNLFVIPKTYFVLLLNDKNEDFYYAKYKDLYGYVLKNQVTVMRGTPSCPYANSTFRIFSPQGQNVYSMPYLNSTRITSIPYLCENITYYGSAYGEQAIPEKSQEWYYCNYFDNNNFYGYVYSVFCDKLTPIGENTEAFQVVQNPVFSSSSNESLSEVSMTFIIIAVSLPCIIVIYLLLKPTLISQKVLDSSPKKKRKHGDYFEFDDSDLN